MNVWGLGRPKHVHRVHRVLTAYHAQIILWFQTKLIWWLQSISGIGQVWDRPVDLLIYLWDWVWFARLTKISRLLKLNFTGSFIVERIFVDCRRPEWIKILMRIPGVRLRIQLILEYIVIADSESCLSVNDWVDANWLRNNFRWWRFLFLFLRQIVHAPLVLIIFTLILPTSHGPFTRLFPKVEVVKPRCSRLRIRNGCNWLRLCFLSKGLSTVWVSNI